MAGTSYKELLRRLARVEARMAAQAAADSAVTKISAVQWKLISVLEHGAISLDMLMRSLEGDEGLILRIEAGAKMVNVEREILAQNGAWH